MATTRTFNDMLNEYLTYDLLIEEMVKRDYVLSKIEKDNGWKGGQLIVPFLGAGASSISYGGLTAQNDIAEDKYVRGIVPSQKEVWGSLIFNQRDLYEHDGSGISEKTFLRLLPDSVDRFMDNMKQVVSINLLNGPHFAKAIGDGNSSGVIMVDRPDLFSIGQKVQIDDGNSSPVTGYVTAIDMDLQNVTFMTTRGGSTPVDLTNYTAAQLTKFYNDGAQANAFGSIEDALLSAANNGSSTLYGVNKLSYPYLQAINVDGSTVTSSNILSKIFDAYVKIRSLGKGNANEVVVSYKHFASILKALESTKGGFNVEAGSQATSVYGWSEITIGGVKGNLKVVAVQEKFDDTFLFIDWRGVKFHSNGFFKKRVAPDGKNYFEVRNAGANGYQYIVDMCLFGDLVVSRPSYCGIMHSVNY